MKVITRMTKMTVGMVMKSSILMPTLYICCHHIPNRHMTMKETNKRVPTNILILLSGFRLLDTNNPQNQI